MLRTIATIRKEWLLLMRDKAGLALLFVMPVVLITVMALIQDAPFRDYQEVKFDILAVDNDHGRLGRYIREGLGQSGQFNLIDSLNEQPLSEEKAAQLIREGAYKISITIPKGATAEIVSNANKIVNDISKRMGIPAQLPVKALITDSLAVQLYFDPAAKKAFRSAIYQALDNFLTQVQTDLLLERIQLQLRKRDSTATDTFPAIRLKAVALKETALGHGRQIDVISNSVQHNVPAWSIFAMFFIVIPIAGNMIREREDGSLVRMKLIPGNYLSILTGKLAFFVGICTAQFYLMMLVGLYALPLLDLPRLQLGVDHAAGLITAISIGITATAYGILIGTVFKTPNQALNFGAISIVIFSAIGGIWIPLEVMPEKIQTVGRLSPLSWGLNAINDIYLRNGSIRYVLPDIVKLLTCGLLMLGIAGWVEQRRIA